MPYVKPDPGDSSSQTSVYPVDHMREVAAKILAKAGDYQAQHDAVWQKIQNTIQQDFDPAWQKPLLDLLEPYAARLRASYDWQINLAGALFDAVDAIEGTENAASQAFTPRRPGPQP